MLSQPVQPYSGYNIRSLIGSHGSHFFAETKDFNNDILGIHRFLAWRLAITVMLRVKYESGFTQPLLKRLQWT